MATPKIASFGPVDVSAFTGISGDVKIMASIGYVCLQWARLEMALLSVIYAVEGISMEKGELIYGGMDIIPRVNMAIRLADHAKVHPPLVKRLRNVRKAIQSDLCDRRNQIVHGAHRDMDNGSTTLTMVRWRGDKRQKTFTALDIANLGNEIFELGNETWSISKDYGEWKFGPHRQKNLNDVIT